MATHTALIDVHKELGAKLAPVGSWDLPLFYPGGTVAEHRHCRKNAGLFDLGDRIIARLAGDLKILPLTFEPDALQTGEVTYGFWLHPNGNIAADLTVCKMGDGDCLASFGSGVSAALVTALSAKLPDSVTVQQLNGVLSSFMLLGRKANEVMQNCCDEQLPELDNWAKLTFSDEGEEFRSIVLKREVFGETAWEFIFNAEFAADLYDIFYRDVTVEPAGVTAFESLRIESLTPGFAEFTGHTPEQCFNRGGQDVKFIAARLPRHPARPGAEITDVNGNKLGTVTSGAFCPADECAKVLGFVNHPGEIAPGTVWNFGGAEGEII